MNKELYKNIKTELDSLLEELSTPSYVCGQLLSQKLAGKNEKDTFTIIYAFYEYMSKKEAFSFINEGTWADFYRKNLSNYLTEDNIKNNIYDIISDENLVNTILKVCTEDVKENLHKYMNAENKAEMKETNNIKKFPERSINKVVEEKTHGSMVVDSNIISKLTSNSAVAVTMPKNIYQKVKQGFSNYKEFRELPLNIIEIDSIKNLKVNKKESIFDKIASSDNALVRDIANSAKEKLRLLKTIVKPSVESISIVKKCLKNASEKTLGKISLDIENTYTSYNDLDQNNKSAYMDDDFDKKEDFAQRVSDYGVSSGRMTV